MDPIIGLLPHSNCNCGTADPATAITNKKDKEQQPPPKSRGCLLVYFSCSLRTVNKPFLQGKIANQGSKNTSQNCT